MAHHLQVTRIRQVAAHGQRLTAHQFSIHGLRIHYPLSVYLVSLSLDKTTDFLETIGPAERTATVKLCTHAIVSIWSVKNAVRSDFGTVYRNSSDRISN